MRSRCRIRRNPAGGVNLTGFSPLQTYSFNSYPDILHSTSKQDTGGGGLRHILIKNIFTVFK